MSPTRSENSQLGLELVYLDGNHSRTSKKPSMAKEKRNGGEKDYINLFLEKDIT
jgi:hypothetical protein